MREVSSEKEKQVMSEESPPIMKAMDAPGPERCKDSPMRRKKAEPKLAPMP